MRNPVAWITFFFSMGIIVSSRLRAPFFLVWAGAMLCCALSLLRIRVIMISLAVFLCGWMCLINADTLPQDHIGHLAQKARGTRCLVTGRLASEPAADGSRTIFDLETERVLIGEYSYNCSGIMRVVLNANAPFEYGQKVAIRGMLLSPSTFRGHRRVSVADFLANKGIYAIFRAQSARHISPANFRALSGFIAVPFRMKKRFQHMIHAQLPPIAAGIMEAMLLGDRKNIPRTVYNDMVKSGTVHILVVSGFNVGVIAGLCALVLKVLRIHRMARFAVIVPALIFYCMMTGASPPVVRATIMGIFLFFSWYVRRDPSIPQALSLSAFAILIFAPRQLYDASFQLSFSAVLALCILSPAIEKLLHTAEIPVRPVRWFTGLVISSLSAWLGTAGFIAYYFRMISPITVIANIFIPLVASFITLCGAGVVACGFVCPYIANSFASVSECLIIFLLRLNGFLIHIPGAYIRFP